MQLSNPKHQAGNSPKKYEEKIKGRQEIQNKLLKINHVF